MMKLFSSKVIVKLLLVFSLICPLSSSSLSIPSKKNIIPKISSFYTNEVDNIIETIDGQVYRFEQTIEPDQIEFILGLLTGSGFAINNALYIIQPELKEKILIIGVNRKLPPEVMKFLSIKEYFKESVFLQALHFQIRNDVSQDNIIDFGQLKKYWVYRLHKKNVLKVQDTSSPNLFRYDGYYDIEIPTEFVLGFLIAKGIDITQAWYARGDTQCEMFDEIVSPELKIQIPSHNIKEIEYYNLRRNNLSGFSRCENISVNNYSIIKR